MRWVWPIVLACLMAASIVSPQRVDRREQQAPALDAAPTTRAAFARRESIPLPDLRLGLYLLAAAPAIDEPALVAIGGTSYLIPTLASCVTAVARARGPPTA